ncbi:segregation/condensation protein A [Streptomyces griseoloalbus]|uniref:Segregation and condensation protein A n=1 Tax=Streptomyces griseoloalbus TaxID=67303 RepID=A0ABV3EGQ9_9ACTN
MTSNDAPASAPGGRPNRRRALGRGPGAVSQADRPAAPTGPDAPRVPVAPGPVGGPPAEGEGTAELAEPSVRPAQAVPTSAERAAEPGPPSQTPPRNDPDGSPRTTLPDVAAGPGAPPAAASHPGAPAPGTEPREGLAPGEEPHDGAGRPGTAPERLSGDLPGTAAVRARDAGDPPASGPGGLQPEAGSVSGGEDGDGRFKVRLSNFEGPFDLLLQLISKHKLDVTEVALSKVTDEFMAYIRAMGPDWDLDETTEFLVVAATLLDLKAARLLPAAEVEDEADLALLEARDLLFARLLQYRAYKRIAEIFSSRLDDEGRRYPRTVGLEPQHAELLPEVVISIGAEGFAKLAVKAMQPRPKPQVYVDHIHAPLVSVREQAGIVVARLKELGEARFRELVADTEDTLTVVARFLALLELYREKAVALDQETALGELTVRWTGEDGDAAPTVTDEFDRPPEQPKEERKA